MKSTNIKEELKTFVNEVDIASFFSKIDFLLDNKEITLISLPLYNELRQRFIANDMNFAYYQQLIAFVDGNIRLKQQVQSNSQTQSALCVEISKILGQEVFIQEVYRNEFEHLLKLYTIHKNNLQSSEQAAAQWGELAPSIIRHKIQEAEQKIEEVKQKMNNLL